ncbi:MAG: SHOCT domain-containing protein [Chloroflexota bacterium]
MRRRRGPSLLATAVVVGGAAHVGASSANKKAQAQANEDAQNQQIAELQAEQAAAAAPPPAATPAAPAAPAVDPTTAELQKLASLHSQGILTDEEFAAAKAKALGI